MENTTKVHEPMNSLFETSCVFQACYVHGIVFLLVFLVCATTPSGRLSFNRAGFDLGPFLPRTLKIGKQTI